MASSFDYLALPHPLRLEICDHIEALRDDIRVLLFACDLHRTVLSSTIGNFRLACRQTNAEFLSRGRSTYLQPLERFKRAQEMVLTTRVGPTHVLNEIGCSAIGIGFYITELIRSRAFVNGVPNDFQYQLPMSALNYPVDHLPSYPRIRLHPNGRITMHIMLSSSLKWYELEWALVVLTERLLTASAPGWTTTPPLLRFNIVADSVTMARLHEYVAAHPFRIPPPTYTFDNREPLLGPWPYTFEVMDTV